MSQIYFQDNPGSRLPALDGVRAIAILAVVGFHAGLGFMPGGFVGVDLFFVLSGFLITGLILSRIDRGTFLFSQFYAERTLRIVPPLLLMLIGSLLAAAALGFLPFILQKIGGTAAASAAFVSNIYFIRNSGYFKTPPDREPFLHTWSLSVEEQYYLVAPLALVLLTSFALCRDWNRNRSGILLCALLFIASGAAMIALTYGTEFMNNIAFYSPVTRAFQFAAGGLVAFASREQITVSTAKADTMAAAGLLMIGASIVFVPEGARIPGWPALLPTAGAGLLLFGLVCAPRGLIGSTLSLRPLVLIGLVSYSWYLWHWPTIVFARMYDFGEANLKRDLIAALLSFGLATATYFFLEIPMKRYRQSPALPSSSRRVLAVSTACIALTITFSLGFEFWNKKRFDNVEFVAFRDAKKEPRRNLCTNRRQDIVKNLDNSRMCLFPGEGPVRLLVWGDSHAESLAAGLLKRSQSERESSALAIRPACPPVLDMAPPLPNRIPDKNCPIHNAAVLDWLSQERLREPIGVVLAAAWGGYVDAADRHSAESRELLFTKKLGATIKRLNELGIKVILAGPVPAWKSPAPECIYESRARQQNADRCGASRFEIEQQNEKSTKALLAAIPQGDSARYIDTLTVFCDANWCRPFNDSEILYRDTNHLSDAGARDLFRAIDDQLKWLLAKEH